MLTTIAGRRQGQERNFKLVWRQQVKDIPVVLDERYERSRMNGCNDMATNQYRIHY